MFRQNLLRTFGKRARDGIFGESDDGNLTPPEEYDERADVNRWHKYIGDIEARHKSEVLALHAALQQEKDRNTKMKESVDKMQFAMENKDLFIGHQDSDDMLSARFQALISKIKTWSIPFAQGNAVISQDYSEIEIRDIHKISPNVGDFQRFLQVPKNMRLFIRGLVGLAMTDTVFRASEHGSPQVLAGHDVWMDHDLAFAASAIEQRFYNAGTFSWYHAKNFADPSSLKRPKNCVSS